MLYTFGILAVGKLLPLAPIYSSTHNYMRMPMGQSPIAMLNTDVIKLLDFSTLLLACISFTMSVVSIFLYVY